MSLLTLSDDAIQHILNTIPPLDLLNFTLTDRRIHFLATTHLHKHRHLIKNYTTICICADNSCNHHARKCSYNARHPIELLSLIAKIGPTNTAITSYIRSITLVRDHNPFGGRLRTQAGTQMFSEKTFDAVRIPGQYYSSHFLSRVGREKGNLGCFSTTLSLLLYHTPNLCNLEFDGMDTALLTLGYGLDTTGSVTFTHMGTTVTQHLPGTINIPPAFLTVKRLTISVHAYSYWPLSNSALATAMRSQINNHHMSIRVHDWHVPLETHLPPNHEDRTWLRFRTLLSMMGNLEELYFEPAVLSARQVVLTLKALGEGCREFRYRKAEQTRPTALVGARVVDVWERVNEEVAGQGVLAGKGWVPGLESEGRGFVLVVRRVEKVRENGLEEVTTEEEEEEVEENMTLGKHCKELPTWQPEEGEEDSMDIDDQRDAEGEEVVTSMENIPKLAAEELVARMFGGTLGVGSLGATRRARQS